MADISALVAEYAGTIASYVLPNFERLYAKQSIDAVMRNLFLNPGQKSDLLGSEITPFGAAASSCYLFEYENNLYDGSESLLKTFRQNFWILYAENSTAQSLVFEVVCVDNDYLFVRFVTPTPVLDKLTPGVECVCLLRLGVVRMSEVLRVNA